MLIDIWIPKIRLWESDGLLNNCFALNNPSCTPSLTNLDTYFSLELLCIAFNSLGTVIKGPRGLKISSHKEKRSTFLWFFEILYLIWTLYGLVLRKRIYQHMGLSLYANHEINHPLVSKAICFTFVCIVLNTNAVKLNLHSRETIRVTGIRSGASFQCQKSVSWFV